MSYLKKHIAHENLLSWSNKQARSVLVFMRHTDTKLTVEL